MLPDEDEGRALGPPNDDLVVTTPPEPPTAVDQTADAFHRSGARRRAEPLPAQTEHRRIRDTDSIGAALTAAELGWRASDVADRIGRRGRYADGGAG